MWIVSIRPPANSSHIPSTWRNFMAMLSKAQRNTAPLSSGTGWPVLRQKARMASGMSPGARKSAASGLTNDRSGGCGGGRAG